jgi:hypothetical protein
MKAFLPVTLSLLLAFPACSSSDRLANDAEQFAEGMARKAESMAGRPDRSYQNKDPYLTREFTLAGAGELRVQTSGGNITVAGTDGNRVKVNMYVNKSSWGKNPSAKEVEEALENYTIDISQNGNTVSAIAENKSKNWSGNNNVSISFVVQVPRAIATQLRTSGGNITLDQVDGKQDLKTSGGSISATGIGGDLAAHTSGGDIAIQSYKGTLDARTSGGNIRLENGSGTLKMHTSGGNITLSGIAGGVEAKTSGGNITADLDKPRDFVTLATSGGNVSVTMPQGIGMDVDIRGSKVNTSFQNFKGDFRSDRVTGKVDGGGIPVDLRTSGGRINLVQR